jgi:hypothetical protein
MGFIITCKWTFSQWSADNVSITLGTINSSLTMVKGKAPATLTSGTTGGVAKVSVKLDDQVVNTSVTINT